MGRGHSSANDCAGEYEVDVDGGKVDRCVFVWFLAGLPVVLDVDWKMSFDHVMHRTYPGEVVYMNAWCACDGCGCRWETRLYIDRSMLMCTRAFIQDIESDEGQGIENYAMSTIV